MTKRHRIPENRETKTTARRPSLAEVIDALRALVDDGTRVLGELETSAQELRERLGREPTASETCHASFGAEPNFRGWMSNSERALFAAAKVYAEHLADQSADALGFRLAVLAWQVVTGARDPNDALEAAKTARADGGPQASADELAKAASGKKDSSEIGRVSRVYALLSRDADVGVRADSLRGDPHSPDLLGLLWTTRKAWIEPGSPD